MTALILGGGISGLTTARKLTQRGVKVTLLEKENRLGGTIQTDRVGEQIFERGPRTFSEPRSPHLLQLIHELGLREDLLFSEPGKRYLLHKGRLRSLSHFWPLLLFRWPRKITQEETIYEFACRSYSRKAAELLFDPLTLGIYGGDIRKLSMPACFPNFGKWKKGRLFTLKSGMSRLIAELERQTPAEIIRNCEVESIGDREVRAGGKIWRADQIYCALPAEAVNRLFQAQIPVAHLSAVQVGFPEAGLSKPGYGYLVPTRENKTLLGMIWDSSIFPTQCSGSRFTAMVRGPNPIPTALDALQRHLKIQKTPIHISSFPGSIPQFEVGHAHRIERLQAYASSKGVILLGNYLTGVAVEDCIKHIIKIFT